MSLPQELSPRIAALLAGAGLPATVRAIESCARGGNNRTYRITTNAGRFAAKHYFRHAGDARDRLATEFAFLAYVEKVAPEFAPKPFAMDADAGIALYEFVDGEPLQPGDVGAKEVAQAAAFFRAINTSGAKSHAARLPAASEACFSINDHLDLIDARLARLREIPPGSTEDEQAGNFIRELSARWRGLAQEVIELAFWAGADPAQVLAIEQRCVSPSDFGFHNALRGMDGGLKFLDFEYAGWDDPAKMTGDFFAQVALPVPGGLFTAFVRDAMEPFGRPAELARRARLLRPVYQVKWCCIALNIFLPLQLARRRFSDPGLDEAAAKQAQLAKAQALLLSLERIDHGLH